MDGYDFLCHKVCGFSLRHPPRPAPGAAPPEPSLPQAFFCGRSEYFRALLDDHFQESEQLAASGGLPAVTLQSVSPEVFTHVLYYVYSNHTEVRYVRAGERGVRPWAPEAAGVCALNARNPEKQRLRRRACLSLLCADVQGGDSTQLGGRSGGGTLHKLLSWPPRDEGTPALGPARQQQAWASGPSWPAPGAPGAPSQSPGTLPHSLLLQVPPELAYDVLVVADMYLLPGLKQLCGRSLAQLLDKDSVVGVWRVAKLFSLARLEDQCTKYMARVIEEVSVGPGRPGPGRGRALIRPVHSWCSRRSSWRPCGRRLRP